VNSITNGITGATSGDGGSTLSFRANVCYRNTIDFTDHNAADNRIFTVLRAFKDVAYACDGYATDFRR
jgi:hypothetical protein